MKIVITIVTPGFRTAAAHGADFSSSPHRSLPAAGHHRGERPVGGRGARRALGRGRLRGAPRARAPPGPALPSRACESRGQGGIIGFRLLGPVSLASGRALPGEERNLGASRGKTHTSLNLYVAA